VTCRLPAERALVQDKELSRGHHFPAFLIASPDRRTCTVRGLGAIFNS